MTENVLKGHLKTRAQEWKGRRMKKIFLSKEKNNF